MVLIRVFFPHLCGVRPFSSLFHFSCVHHCFHPSFTATILTRDLHHMASKKPWIWNGTCFSPNGNACRCAFLNYLPQLPSMYASNRCAFQRLQYPTVLSDNSGKKHKIQWNINGSSSSRLNHNLRTDVSRVSSILTEIIPWFVCPNMGAKEPAIWTSSRDNVGDKHWITNTMGYKAAMMIHSEDVIGIKVDITNNMCLIHIKMAIDGQQP